MSAALPVCILRHVGRPVALAAEAGQLLPRALVYLGHQPTGKKWMVCQLDPFPCGKDFSTWDRRYFKSYEAALREFKESP